MPPKPQPLRRRKPHPLAGEPPRSAVDGNVVGLPAAQQIGDHRDQMFGVAAPDQFMPLIDDRAIHDQGHRASRLGGFDGKQHVASYSNYSDLLQYLAALGKADRKSTRLNSSH